VAHELDAFKLWGSPEAGVIEHEGIRAKANQTLKEGLAFSHTLETAWRKHEYLNISIFTLFW
jgi:hypothetical protein